MDLKLLRHLVRLMERGELNELKIDDQKAGLSVHFKRGRVVEGTAGAPVVMMSGGASPTPVLPEAPRGPAAAAPEAGAPEADLGDLSEIKSPMVGTFYRSPNPDAAPFVQVGDTVEKGAVVCIVEAMKVMNEIESEVAGVVKEILVEDGQPVEFGQTLFLVDPA